MNKLTSTLFACLFCSFPVAASDLPSTSEAPQPNTLTIREIRYNGKLSDDEARFAVNLDIEALARGESSAVLFDGDIAVLPSRLPDGLKVIRDGSRYVLVTPRSGRFKLKLDLVAKIHRAEPWNQISFTGPVAAITSVSAEAAGGGMEVQLLSGTPVDSIRTNGGSRVEGFLGAERTVALRWQSKVAEVTRKALLTVESAITAQVARSVIKYTSRFHYDIVQGNPAQLTLALPAAQALTRLVGDQIRDWRTVVEGDRQILTVDFIKPLEKACDLTLFSEQPVDATQAEAAAALRPPQPLEVDRESGALTLATEDTIAEVESLSGLRQVNASAGAFAAYRFSARPFALALKLKRIEPAISVSDRIHARLEETRLIATHDLMLNVEKAGIYSIDLSPQAEFTVADIRGEGIDDWKVSDGKLRVSFAARVLGSRALKVQLEQALKQFPDRIDLAPLRVAGAARETAQVGVASAPGLRLKTAELSGLREIPIRALAGSPGGAAAPSDELLAYAADQPDWKLALASERLAARVIADVFNLVTIGDGIVGGSATIRYGMLNQGVQEFTVRLPARCKNVEFTGLNIRRKEISGGTSYTSPTNNESGTRIARPSETDTNFVVWTIGLQDKAWGAYTLVVTYDYQFDPKGAQLPVAGVHAMGVERETGSIAVTTAASLQLDAKPSGESLRRTDEHELVASDRALINRAVVLAYQYMGQEYDLNVNVKRYEPEDVLEAVADRTQLTSVLNPDGQMLTQASFMVKNNQKQFQGFVLPKNATLWGCYVNGQPAKPERNGEQVLVSLPRDLNRDQAFAVDIVYAETNGPLAARWSHTLNLTAPRTDVPNTYAEWQLFVPAAFRLSHFGGSMNVAQGTTYELLDAWERFLTFYVQVLREAGGAILVIGVLALLVIALVISSARKGWNGAITVLAVLAIFAVLAAMMLPALSKAKSKAQRISSVNNLKQIGLALKIWSGDNGDRLPVSFEQMANELGSDKITYDPESGQRYVYLGGGMSADSLQPDSVLAYSPIFNGHGNVLLADGSVQQVTAAQFAEMSQRGLVRMATPAEIAGRQQREAVERSQALAVQEQAPPPRTPAAMPPRGAGFGRGGFGGGGFGGGSGLAAGVPGNASMSASGAVELPAAGEPTRVAGIRSLRIDLPQTGQPFLFTKVLNVRDEPLSIQMRVMSMRAFQGLQMTWQVAAFLLGVAVFWLQLRRARPSSFVLALALALIIGSIGSLLVQWRALHDALIVGFPLVVLSVIAALTWKFWPRERESDADFPAHEPPQPGSNLPPVAAALVLGLFLAKSNASAVSTPSPPSIVSAAYSGTVNDRVALLDAVLQLSAGKSTEPLPLFGEEVAVQQFTVKRGDAKLVREGDALAIKMAGRGDATIQLKMLVKVSGDVTRRHLTFSIPPALSSQVSLALDQPEADVDFPTAVSFKRTLEGERTRVDAVIGSEPQVELLWTPRVKRAAEVAATVFCQNGSLVTFGSGVVNIRSTLDFQITQGELRQARVQLPPGQKLLRVEGASIRTWESKQENGTEVLVVDLLKGVSPLWQLTVETERTLDPLPATLAVEVPHALDVKRETGMVALQNAEELGLSVESASDVQRVDVGEFSGVGDGPAGTGDNPKTGGKTPAPLFSVFRFSKPEFALRVRATALQPQIEALVRNQFRISAEQVTLSATIDYTIKRAGVFAFRVALPDGYRMDRATGANILQSVEHKENGARVLELTLRERTLGAYTARIEFTRNFRELPVSLPLEGVHPLGAEKLTGFISVSTEAGVGAKVESFDGLSEIPAASLPEYASLGNTGGVLAYKYILQNPKSSPEWKLAVTTETIEAWVRAEVVNTLNLSETLVSGRSVVRFDIANAPVKEFRLRIPAECRNVEFNGANIRSHSQTGEVWLVELQSRTRGIYPLTVTWEQPRSARTNAVEFSGISADGVERETGFVVVTAKAPLQTVGSSARDLQRIDSSEIPEWAGATDRNATLAYRYLRPGFQLVVNTRRFDEAEVLQALVDNAKFTTVIADDGQMMTEMALTVRNNGRQFLEIALPANANVWSAFVAGQPVRPSVADGRLLVPVQQSGSDGASISVELTYVSTNSFPEKRGAVAFHSPLLDVPVKSAHWELFLPPDYNYEPRGGSMSREIAAAESLSSSFSRLDYSRMEKANYDSTKAEFRRDVAQAKRKLAEGDVREATITYNRAKGNYIADKEVNDEVKQLEKALQTAQGSNLVNAQNDFIIRNGGQFVVGQNAQVQTPENIALYDNATAEQQWARLQQAQEIVAPKVQPLRVNLPVRGQRYSFTQVLQTEIGKPMSIRLLAISTKAVSWPKRIGTVAIAFLLLWGAVAAALRMTQSRRMAKSA